MTIFELDRTSLEALARLLQHEGLSFREQVHLARLDPQSDFFRVDLSGIDLSGEDLRGFEFCEVNFSGSNLLKGLQGIEWVVLRGHSGGNGCGEGLSWL